MGILTNNNKVDWDTEYYGIDLSLVDNIFFRTFDDATTRVEIMTRRVGFNVPEFNNWVNINHRTAIGEDPIGVPASLVDNFLRFNTTFMFNDNKSFQLGVPKCHGIFKLQQLAVGVQQTSPNNTRGVEVIIDSAGTKVKPDNLPCIGVTKGLDEYTGEVFLHVYVNFPESFRNDYIDLVQSINEVLPLSSDEGAFDNALKEAQRFDLPDKLFHTK